MPLPERVIQPINVSRGTLSYQVPDELEGVTNGTLANIIRQLSSLSRHAEEMFGNLFAEAENVAARSCSLQAKIDKLAVRVTRLDSTVEEVSLQDIQMRKAFRSSQAFDQQVVSRDTMPKAMLEAYLACDQPPPLNKLNLYRDDGKDALKFYTDPKYFFELWRQEMLKDTERAMHDKGRKPGKAANGGVGQKADGGRQRKRVRQPHNTAERQRQKAVEQGEYIVHQPHQHEEATNGYNRSPYDDGRRQQQQRPNSIEIRRAYEQQLELQERMSGLAVVNGNVEDPPSAFAYGLAQQEPIYTPRILRNHEENPSQRMLQLQQQQQQQLQRTGDVFVNFDDDRNHPVVFGATDAAAAAAAMAQEQLQHHQLQQFNPGYRQQRLELLAAAAAGSPTKINAGQRRPSQPPPAPPPGGGGSTTVSPTRPQRDSLPPPPPPPAEVVANGGAALQFISSPSSNSSSPTKSVAVLSTNSPASASHQDDTLPPPPPVPTATFADGGNVVKMSSDRHLPPSPPPPPAPVQASTAPTSAPPPPPPPPPAAAAADLTNGHNGNDNEKLSPRHRQQPILQSILSPPALKKPSQPSYLRPQDGVRSDLLKAIRDGIALKKVEQRQQAKAEESAAASGKTDVASILARRVAVEMSDSEGGGPSDSEYDSDDWGDESTA